MPKINLEQITNTIQFVHAPSTALKIPPDVCLCHSTAFLCNPLIPHEMASTMNGNSAFYLLHERTGFTLLALANGWHEILIHSPLLCQAGSQQCCCSAKHGRVRTVVGWFYLCKAVLQGQLYLGVLQPQLQLWTQTGRNDQGMCVYKHTEPMVNKNV